MTTATIFSFYGRPPCTHGFSGILGISKKTTPCLEDLGWLTQRSHPHTGAQGLREGVLDKTPHSRCQYGPEEIGLGSAVQPRPDSASLTCSCFALGPSNPFSKACDDPSLSLPLLSLLHSNQTGVPTAGSRWSVSLLYSDIC